jgi:hypothetical protein
LDACLNTKCRRLFWRHDNQHNDIQHDDTQNRGLIRDIQHNGFEYNNTAIMLNVVMLTVAFCFLLCDCRYAECLYTDCRYAECRGASYIVTVVSYDRRALTTIDPVDDNTYLWQNVSEHPTFKTQQMRDELLNKNDWLCFCSF